MKKDSTFYYKQDLAERQVSGGEPIAGTNLTTQYITDVQETVVEGFDFPPLPNLSGEQGSEVQDILKEFDWPQISEFLIDLITWVRISL